MREGNPIGEELSMSRWNVLTIVCALLVFGTAGCLHAWNDGYYTTGIVTSVTAPDKLVIGARTYTVSPKCEIISQLRNGPSIYEKRASFYDIHRGDPVLVKIEGSTLKNVALERWKQ